MEFQNTKWSDWRNNISSSFKDWSENIQLQTLRPHKACVSYTCIIKTVLKKLSPKRLKVFVNTQKLS